MFNNARYVTRGIIDKVDLCLQLFMWGAINDLKIEKDYLQVFNCSSENGKQKIEHIQEEPEFKKEYLFYTDTPIFVGKIFVIDDETHSTMLLAEEY